MRADFLLHHLILRCQMMYVAYAGHCGAADAGTNSVSLKAGRESLAIIAAAKTKHTATATVMCAFVFVDPDFMLGAISSCAKHT